MNRLGLLSVLALSTIASCTPPYIPIKMVTPCSKRSIADITHHFTGLLASKGLIITMSNDSLGIITATSTTQDQSSFFFGPAFVARGWQIFVKGDTLIAMAVANISTTNDYGNVTATKVATFDDQSAEQEGDWYWDVRRSLESYCGAPVQFIGGGVDNTRPNPPERR